MRLKDKCWRFDYCGNKAAIYEIAGNAETGEEILLGLCNDCYHKRQEAITQQLNEITFNLNESDESDELPF